jgi:hypothetical protein
MVKSGCKNAKLFFCRAPILLPAVYTPEYHIANNTHPVRIDRHFVK